MRNYLDDPQQTALNELLLARRYLSGISPFETLRHKLGSDENVWTVIKRLRRAGHKIKTFPRTRRRSYGITPDGQRRHAGYALIMTAKEAGHGRLGFNILGDPDTPTGPPP